MTNQQPQSAGETSLSLEMRKALGGSDELEIISVTISKVPPSARLSAGTDTCGGVWSLTDTDLEGLAYLVPSGGSGEVTVSISAAVRPNAADASGPPANPTTTAFGIAVPVAPGDVENEVSAEPAPTPEPIPVTAPDEKAVPQGEAIALEIDTGFSDADAPEGLRIVISGVPLAAGLTAGTDNGDGSWALSPADLGGLNILLPPGTGPGFTLGIAVTSTNSLLASGSLIVERDDAAPSAPEPAPETAPEPEPVPEPVMESVLEPEPQPLVATDIDDAATTGCRPIAYWKLDEASGTITVDEMGNHPGRVSGVGGRAIASFNGIDDYIDVSHSADMSLPGGTFTVWFSAFATASGTLAAKGAPGSSGHFALKLKDGALEFLLQSTQGAHVVRAGSIGLNEWNQVSLTWGPGGLKAYMNGDVAGADETAGDLAANQSPWIFGAAETADAPQTIGDFFHGELDDIAIYGEPLNTAEVRELCQIGVKGLMTGEQSANVVSVLDFAAIPAEASGPESLGTLDTPVEMAPEPDIAPEPTPQPAPEPVLEAAPEINDGAISIAEGNDLILEGGETVEW